MENRKRKSTGLLLSILGVISLILITAGVTYAFFSYAKQGEKSNTISTGSITFIYNETSERLNITDALPKVDSVGTTENATQAFEFTVTSTTPGTAYINYIVTARMDSTSTLSPDQVKLYLTSTLNSGNEGNEGSGWTTGIKVTDSNGVKVFDDLDDVTDSAYSSVWGSNTLPANTVEKVIYAGQVPTSRGSSNNYVRTFRMNMWLKGAEEVEAHCEEDGVTVDTVNSEPATEQNCTGGDYQWVSASQNTAGMPDYSAFEFVKKSVAGGSSAINVSTLVEDASPVTATWLKSVPYYAGLEAASPTINANDWTRIAYVNYAEGKIITKYQIDESLVAAPSLGTCTVGGNTTEADCTDDLGTWTPSGWEASEQYYPFNGGTFKVTINVYAEGATTYTVPSNNG